MLTDGGILFSGVLFCLIGSLFAFAVIAKKKKPSLNAPFFALSCILAFAVIVTSFFFWKQSDFISSVTLPAFIAPAVCLPGLALLTLAFPKPRLQFLALALCCAALVFGLNLSVVFSENLPAVVNLVLSFLLWLSVCFIPRVFNLNLGLLCIETLTIALGCLLLFFINALPFALGFLSGNIAACFLALLIAGRSNKNLLISDQMCNLLGFLLGWLVILTLAEGTGSCLLTFALYPLIELIVVLAQKLTFLPQYAIAKNNTLYIHIVSEEISPPIVNRHFLRISAICILFGCFQAFAPNIYSIPSFTLLVVFWQLYRIFNWRESSLTLKETNQRLLNTVRKNLQEVSKNFKKGAENKE